MAGAKRIGLVGARGYVGRELVELLDLHEDLDLAWASSRSLAGKPVTDVVDDVKSDVVFEDLSPEQAAERDVDAVVLALPNGEAARWVDAYDSAGSRAVIVDVSSDHRFDDSWAYGLPERNRVHLREARRIANPGCYATGIQIGLAPLLPLLEGPVHAFGVSGHSGAGATPSRKNDLSVLESNLLPYALCGHTHEKEVTYHLEHAVRFVPHVAPFFRGISLTLSVQFREGYPKDDLYDLFHKDYADEPLVRLVRRIPVVKEAAYRHDVTVGGFAAHPEENRAVLVVTLDNLRKGAATQVVQNLNLALGLDEHAGIPSE